MKRHLPIPTSPQEMRKGKLEMPEACETAKSGCILCVTAIFSRETGVSRWANGF